MIRDEARGVTEDDFISQVGQPETRRSHRISGSRVSERPRLFSLELKSLCCDDKGSESASAHKWLRDSGPTWSVDYCLFSGWVLVVADFSVRLGLVLLCSAPV
eukprot:5447373-Amphidinium_carterae.1